MDKSIRDIIASETVISARDRPELRRDLDRAAHLGTIVRLLPGIYVAARAARGLETRMVAATLYHRSAVVIGDAAAAMTYWRDLEVPTIDVAGIQCRANAPGYRFVRQPVPPELVDFRWGIRYAKPALAALQQVASRGGDGIDRALREREATLADMWSALRAIRGQRGNTDRRVLLQESYDEPWSELERRMHRLLRQAGITGWRTNVAVGVKGATFRVDILFDAVPLAIELDGKEFHGADRFDDDRERGDYLLLAGMHVLRFTWTMVTQRPDWVIATVREALLRVGGDAVPRR